MNPLAAAELLRALASRVRRNHPLNHDPERFHIEASEIARGLLDIADVLDPGALRCGRATVTVDQPAPARKGRIKVTTTTAIIGGRAVAVQRRRLPFSVYVG